MILDNFLGNESVKNTLFSAIASRKFPHAVVLQGEHGTGKRTFAKLLAQALVCQLNKGVPCGKCPSCIRAIAGSHPDIKVEEGSGASRLLSVDSIKNIIADSYRKPAEADYKVYLIFIENKISEIAQNKLLKVVEEPPGQAVFIFTCKNAEILLPTIRSRVQIFTMRAPEISQSANWLSESKEIPFEQALALSKICDGNIGKMLSETENGTAALIKETANALVRTFAVTSEHEIFAVSAPLIKDRRLFADVLAEMQSLLRQAILIKNGADFLDSEQIKTNGLAKLSVKKLLNLQALTRDYILKIERNANMNLLVSCFCAQARKLSGR